MLKSLHRGPPPPKKGGGGPDTPGHPPPPGSAHANAMVCCIVKQLYYCVSLGIQKSVEILVALVEQLQASGETDVKVAALKREVEALLVVIDEMWARNPYGESDAVKAEVSHAAADRGIRGFNTPTLSGGFLLVSI